MARCGAGVLSCKSNQPTRARNQTKFHLFTAKRCGRTLQGAIGSSYHCVKFLIRIRINRIKDFNAALKLLDTTHWAYTYDLLTYLSTLETKIQTKKLKYRKLNWLKKYKVFQNGELYHCPICNTLVHSPIYDTLVRLFSVVWPRAETSEKCRYLGIENCLIGYLYRIVSSIPLAILSKQRRALAVLSATVLLCQGSIGKRSIIHK